MGKGASQGAAAAAAAVWQSPGLNPPLRGGPQSHPDLLEGKAAETCCVAQLCSPSAEPGGWRGSSSTAVPFLLGSGFCCARKQKKKITWRELKAS